MKNLFIYLAVPILALAEEAPEQEIHQIELFVNDTQAVDKTDPEVVTASKPLHEDEYVEDDLLESTEKDEVYINQHHTPKEPHLPLDNQETPIAERNGTEAAITPNENGEETLSSDPDPYAHENEQEIDTPDSNSEIEDHPKEASSVEVMDHDVVGEVSFKNEGDCEGDEISNPNIFGWDTKTVVPELESDISAEDEREWDNVHERIYGLPKNLMPILPGGGSRFQDLEKEKQEKAKNEMEKMHPAKITRDETERKASHAMKGLDSSAITFRISFLIFFFSLTTMLIS